MLQSPDGQKSAIYFVQGHPHRIRTADPVIHLGRLLVEQGVLDIPSLEATLEELGSGQRLHGELLMRRGLIDAERRDAALREQAERKVSWLFSLPPETVFGFYPEQDLLQGWSGSAGTPCSPLAALWRGVRDYMPSEEVRDALAPIVDRPLVLHPDAQIAAFCFSKEVLSIIDVLRTQSGGLKELARTSLLSPRLIERLIYTLFISRQLDLGMGPPVRTVPAADHRAAPPPSSRRVFAPPPSPRGSELGGRALALPPEEDDSDLLLDELKARAAAAAGQNYFELLGVEPDASKQALQTAFFTLAKRWHPDRLPPALAE